NLKAVGMPKLTAFLFWGLLFDIRGPLGSTCLTEDLKNEGI
ncbi:unnamed protein product, partial [marine sediment metagenome]